MNSAIVETAFGIILMYLVLGLLCTSINEFIAQLLSLRGENLADTIHGLFTGLDRHRIAQNILDHPLVLSLSRKQFGLNLAGKDIDGSDIVKLPSAIPPKTFSAVVVDLIEKDRDRSPELRYAVEVTQTLKLLGISIEATQNTDKSALESWYQDALDRASGWYKRKVQIVSFLVSFAIALVINADTLVMVDRLSNSPADRAILTAYADQVKKEGDKLVIPAGLQSTTMSFLGWKDPGSTDPRRVPGDATSWLLKLFGLSLTAFAASLGAPFWFDLLSRFMTVRTGGTQRLESTVTVPAGEAKA